MGMIAALLQMADPVQSNYSIAASPGASSPASSATLKKKRLLLCAPSNAAVDELLTRLIMGVPDGSETLSNSSGPRRKILNLVRLGGVTEATRDIIEEYTLDRQVELKLRLTQCWRELEQIEDDIKALLSRLDESRSPESFRGGGMSPQMATSPANRKILNQEILRLSQEKVRKKRTVEHMRLTLRFDVLDNADVVVSTLSGAGNRQLMGYIEGAENKSTASQSRDGDDQEQKPVSAGGGGGRFETVIIDESAQATEPSALIPLRYGCRRLVLVGDPRQLPATVLHKHAAKSGLGVSLFERLERANHEVIMLQVLCLCFIYGCA
jgi:senataxin